MITLDLGQYFKTDPHYSKIPRIVFDWVTEREKLFPQIEYQIRFSLHKSEQEREEEIDYGKYERIYGPSIPDLRNIIFPLRQDIWYVRLIGDIREARIASGLMELLDSHDSRIELIATKNDRLSPRGYLRLKPITPEEEELVDIKCDRNINDEWEFRGTAQEFMDEKVKPLLN
jgi:hypothetical protein